MSTSTLNIKHQKQFSLKQVCKVCNQLETEVFSKQNIGDSENKDKAQKTILQENKLFLIFGATTSGKTLVEYYLSLDELQYGVQEKTKVPYIVPKATYQNAYISRAPITVTTRVPNVRSTILDDNKVVFVQIPDIKALKEDEQVCEYLFLNHVLRTFKHVHFLYVTTSDILDDGTEFLQNFQSLTSLFDMNDKQKTQVLNSKMSLIVNKVDPSYDVGQILEKLQQLNDEAISQQNEQIYEILKAIMSDKRVYIIKQQQPLKQDQTETLRNLLEKSQHTNFYQQQLIYEPLLEIVEDDKITMQMIKKHQVKQLWTEAIGDFHNMVNYMADEKNREELFPKVQQMITEASQRLFGKMIQQPSEQANDQIPRLQGRLSNKIKSDLHSFIKLIKMLSQEQLGSKQIYQKLSQIRNSCLMELGIDMTLGGEAVKQQEESPKKGSPQPSAFPSSFIIYLCKLSEICNQMETILLYISKVLGYGLEGQDESLQMNRNSLIELEKEILQNLKLELAQFNLATLSVGKRKMKGRESILRKTKQSGITILQLRQQFIKQHQNKKPAELLSQIFNLPRSHFKLFLLIKQFTKKQQFQAGVEIVKQMCLILEMTRLFVEQILLLLWIPDWNKIQDVVQMMNKQYRQRKVKDDEVVRDVQFLNKLGTYAANRFRRKISHKVFQIVDYIEKQNQKNLEFDLSTILDYRNNSLSLPQQWYKEEIEDLFKPQKQNKQASYAQIVRKVKLRQQQDQERIDKINGLLFLMSQQPF